MSHFKATEFIEKFAPLSSALVTAQAFAENGVNDSGVKDTPKYNEDGSPYTGPSNGPRVCEGPCSDSTGPVINEGSSSSSNNQSALLATPKSRAELVNQYKELKSVVDSYKSVLKYKSTGDNSALMKALNVLKKK